MRVKITLGDRMRAKSKMLSLDIKMREPGGGLVNQYHQIIEYEKAKAVFEYIDSKTIKG